MRLLVSKEESEMDTRKAMKMTRRIALIIKTRFNNLTIEQTIDLTHEIVEAVEKTLDEKEG